MVQNSLKYSDQVVNGDLLRFYTPEGFTPVDRSKYNYNNRDKNKTKVKRLRKGKLNNKGAIHMNSAFICKYTIIMRQNQLLLLFCLSEENYTDDDNNDKCPFNERVTFEKSSEPLLIYNHFRGSIS